jgi:glutamyl-Q tRNA(Asp) synthetase
MTRNTPPVFRFAPSPNGRLHLGHARSALLNQDFARRAGGRLLLRIEDIDQERCRPAFVTGILEDLAWLGLAWEKPVRRQSEHFSDYREAAARLRGQGLLYPCFCSRRAVAHNAALKRKAWVDPDGAPLYAGTCRSLPPNESERRIASGEPYVWRLAMDRALGLAPRELGYRRFDADFREETVAGAPERWGDAVLVRKDTPTSYHLSVVVDDALQGVTHVVRGTDLEAATDLHVLLQQLLALPTPRYHHHALIRDPGGDKLAKSRGSETLASLRARGWTPGMVRSAVLEHVR